MKKTFITIVLLFPIILFCQEIGKTNDLRDSFVGTYACTGLPWWPACCINTWPIMYVSIEKSLTDSTILFFNDSSFATIGEEYKHPAIFFSHDSTYYKSQGYKGDFKKPDTVHMINVVPGVGGYNIYCPKVIETGIGQKIAKNTFHVFPNPFVNEIYILSPFPKNEIIEAALFDMQGRCVHKETYKTLTNTYILYLQGLQSGVYILKLTNDKERFYKKVLKGI